MVNQENHGSRIEEEIIFVGSAVKGIKGAAGWVKDTAVSAWNGVTGAVGTFIEKTGNWITEGHFKTNEQVEEIRVQERIHEAIRNGTALEEGSAEYNRIMAVLYGNPEVKVGAGGTGEMSHAEYMQKFREMDEKNKNSDIGSNLKKLTGLAQQNNGGNKYVREEIEKALKNIPGGDKLNTKEILSKSCNALTMWITLKEAGANVGEFGEFFEKQVKENNIKAHNAYTGNPYAIASHYNIDGKKLDVGFIDGRNNSLEGFNQYEKLLKSGQVSHGEVYFKTPTSYHALSVYFSQGEIKIADVSYRPNGSPASLYVRDTNFKWFFYVKNGRR